MPHRGPSRFVIRNEGDPPEEILGKLLPHPKATTKKATGGGPGLFNPADFDDPTLPLPRAPVPTGTPQDPENGLGTGVATPAGGRQGGAPQLTAPISTQTGTSQGDQRRSTQAQAEAGGVVGPQIPAGGGDTTSELGPGLDDTRAETALDFSFDSLFGRFEPLTERNQLGLRILLSQGRLVQVNRAEFNVLSQEAQFDFLLRKIAGTEGAGVDISGFISPVEDEEEDIEVVREGADFGPGTEQGVTPTRVVPIAAGPTTGQEDIPVDGEPSIEEPPLGAAAKIFVNVEEGIAAELDKLGFTEDETNLLFQHLIVNRESLSAVLTGFNEEGVDLSGVADFFTGILEAAHGLDFTSLNTLVALFAEGNVGDQLRRAGLLDVGGKPTDAAVKAAEALAQERIGEEEEPFVSEAGFILDVDEKGDVVFASEDPDAFRKSLQTDRESLNLARRALRQAHTDALLQRIEERDLRGMLTATQGIRDRIETLRGSIEQKFRGVEIVNGQFVIAGDTFGEFGPDAQRIIVEANLALSALQTASQFITKTMDPFLADLQEDQNAFKRLEEEKADAIRKGDLEDLERATIDQERIDLQRDALRLQAFAMMMQVIGDPFLMSMMQSSGMLEVLEGIGGFKFPTAFGTPSFVDGSRVPTPEEANKLDSAQLRLWLSTYNGLRVPSPPLTEKEFVALIQAQAPAAARQVTRFSVLS